MVYNPYPPYEIVQNRLIDFVTMQQVRRFARYWDLVGNSGNFRETTPLLWRKPTATCPDSTDDDSLEPSPFVGFMRWSQWLQDKIGRTDSIALIRLMEFLFQFLTHEAGWERPVVAQTLWRDYQRGGRHDKPAFLKDYLGSAPRTRTHNLPAAPKRQARHMA